MKIQRRVYALIILVILLENFDRFGDIDMTRTCFGVKQILTMKTSSNILGIAQILTSKKKRQKQ